MGFTAKKYLLVSVWWISFFLYAGHTDLWARSPRPASMPPIAGSLEAAPVFYLPLFDKDAAGVSYDQNGKYGSPLKIAEQFPVDITPGLPGREADAAVMGSWTLNDDGDWNWRLRVVSEGAVSLNFGFSSYHMPPGGRLWVYNPDYSSVIGPFTSADVDDHGQLWTPLIPGQEAVIEVVVPLERIDDLDLVLAYVNHGCISTGMTNQREAGSCNVDIVCPQGEPWLSQARSVGRLLINGVYLCTGVLLNNTRADSRLLLLTAKHCGVNMYNAPSLVVYWNYQRSTCGGDADGSLDQYSTGSIFLASDYNKDFALVELDDAVDPSYNLYLSGWDNTGIDPDSAVTIHYPMGDEKSISFENDPLITTTFLGQDFEASGDFFRVIDWDEGTTEPGSSGCPLFDPNHRVIGQLYGGEAACDNDLSDWYGKLSAAWTGGDGTDDSLASWLDPLNTGVRVLDGMDAVPINFTIAYAEGLNGSSGSATGDNARSYKEKGEPDHAGNAGGKSMWWKWTAPADAAVNMDTHGSSFDTLLAVYQGTDMNGLETIAANDDDGSSRKNSGLSFVGRQGEKYLIAVDGFNGVSGDIVLNWSSCGAWYYADLDGDGYGNPEDKMPSCSRPGGYVENSDDCNDDDSGIHPAAVEYCDRKDNNCNGLVDEGCSNSSGCFIGFIQ